MDSNYLTDGILLAELCGFRFVHMFSKKVDCLSSTPSNGKIFILVIDECSLRTMMATIALFSI